MSSRSAKTHTVISESPFQPWVPESIGQVAVRPGEGSRWELLMDLYFDLF